MRTAAIVVLGLVLVWGSSAESQRRQPAPPAEEPTLLELLSQRVATRIAEPLAGRRGSVLIEVRTDLAPGAPDAAGLANALVSPLVDALRASGRFWVVQREDGHAESDEDAARRAAARGFDVLARIVIRSSATHLAIDGGVYDAGPRGLHRALAPRPTRIGGVLLRAAIDAQLRTFVGGRQRVTDRTLAARSVPLPSKGYAALAGSDLDGDGTAELVFATPAGVEIARLARGGASAAIVARASWPEVPRAAVPSRRFLAVAAPADRAVLLRTSAHAKAIEVRLDGGAAALAAVDGPCGADAYPLADGCAVPAAGRDYFRAQIAGREDRGVVPDPSPASFYARVSDAVRQPNGAMLAFEAVATARGRLATRVGAQRDAAAGFGAALAMADLDGDGMPELLASSDASIGAGDRISILRVRPTGTVVSIWQSEPLAGSVLIAASADVDGDGAPELLAIEEPPLGTDAPARLWVVR